MSWKDYGDFAFYTTAVVTVAFALLYLVFAPWSRSATGRNIMAVMGSMALGFSYFAWVIYNGGVPAYFYPIRAVIFTFLALSIAWRVWMLLRVQILDRKKEPNDG